MIACSHFYAFFCMEIIIQTYLIENEWTTKFFSTIYNIWQIYLFECCKRAFLKNIVRNSCFFHFFVDFLLTRLAFIDIILNGIVCPTRAPETQVYVKHSNRIGGK